MAGWDFDDGSGSNNGNGTASLPGSLWVLNYSTIEWNGCNQEYPAVDPIPVISCYSQSTEGYGDGVATPPGMCLSANINHSAFNYNTQDGLDLGHDRYGHMLGHHQRLRGDQQQPDKHSNGGPKKTPSCSQNNFALANCLRLSIPFSGAPTSFNTYLSDFCRASDNMSLQLQAKWNRSPRQQHHRRIPANLVRHLLLGYQLFHQRPHL